LHSIIEQAKQTEKLKSNWNTSTITSTIMSVYFYTLMSQSLLHPKETDIKDMLNKQLDVVWEGINKK